MCGIFMDREQLAERFAEAASMPRDVVMGASVITITGRNEICIENYRGILEYTDLLIRVQTKSGQIRLSGKNLQIEYYTNDEKIEIYYRMLRTIFCSFIRSISLNDISTFSLPSDNLTVVSFIELASTSISCLSSDRLVLQSLFLCTAFG